MGFLIIALIFMLITIFITKLAECNYIRYNRILIGFFLFSGITMLVGFAFCPRAEYNEPELIYEICLDEETIEHIGFELSEVNLDKIIRLSDDNMINYIKPTNFKFISSDLTDEIVVQIYKSVPEISFWKPSPGDVIYDCVILW